MSTPLTLSPFSIVYDESFNRPLVPDLTLRGVGTGSENGDMLNSRCKNKGRGKGRKEKGGEVSSGIKECINEVARKKIFFRRKRERE